MKIYTNELSDISKMDAMPVDGKNLKKIFSRTNRPMTLKFGLCHRV